VLYGSLELSPLDTVSLPGGLEVPRTALTGGLVLLINLAAILVLFKEWRISAFDPSLARTVGISPTFMHYLLMGLTAMTTVAVFEAVGSILVIAMLIVPPACAAMVTHRLGSMLIVGALFASGSAVLGHVGALMLAAGLGFNGASTTGMMAVAAGGLFLFTALGRLGMDRFRRLSADA
jgi:manganese/zinc/iron transport system permease protein